MTVLSAGAELVENNDWALAGADRPKASSAVGTKILMKCIVEPPLINLCLELNVIWPCFRRLIKGQSAQTPFEKKG